jgi:hypothetical protein
MVMKSGKKSVAEKIVYGALDRMSERSATTRARALEMLGHALDNIKPAVEVKSRRVGGATYQVPVEVGPRAARRSRCVGLSRPRARDPKRAWPCASRTSSSMRPTIAVGREETRRHAPYGGRESRVRALPW